MAEFLARQRLHAAISFEDYRATNSRDKNPKRAATGAAQGAAQGTANGGREASAKKAISQTELDHDNGLRKEVSQGRE